MWIFNFKQHVKAFSCAIPLLCVSSSAVAEWIGNADVEIRHYGNVNNAQLGNDIAGDSASSASFSETGFFPLEDGYSLSVTGESIGEVFDRYTGLNSLSLGGALDLRKKWALGAYAPWTGLSLSSAHLNFANDIRNGWQHQIAIRGGQRIFERWDVRTEFMVERRTADTLQPDQPGISGDVFSQTSRTLTLDAEYALSERLFLTFGSLLRRGDAVTSARETTKIISSSHAIAVDPVFGPDFYAYRMTGTTYGLSVAMNIAVTPHSLLRASMARQVTQTEGDNDYANNVATLSWTSNF